MVPYGHYIIVDLLYWITTNLLVNKESYNNKNA